MKDRYIPLAVKANIVLIAVLTLGLGAITFFYYTEVNQTITSSVQESLQNQSKILYSAIQNFMLPGEAPLAVRFFKDIQEINPLYNVHLYRSNGIPAFSDNTTIEEVNRRIQKNRFSPRTAQLFQPSPSAPPVALEAVKSRPARDVFEQREREGRFQVFIYKPLINLPKCTLCHGSDHTIRGIAEISTDITASIEKQQDALIKSGVLFLGALVLLSISLGRFLHRQILRPIQEIGTVCSMVTRGDFQARTTIHQNDEIGELGKTVNTMVKGLYERFKLSKYVSASTIQSLSEDTSTKKIVATVLFSDIRGFTAFSEKTSPEQVVRLLNRILSLQTDLIHSFQGDVDKYVGDEIVAVFLGEKAPLNACRAALEIQRAIAGEAQEFRGLGVGIGITQGELIMGMIGSEKRADFTVIGDTVNTASRFCSAARQGQTIISEPVFQSLPSSARVDGPFQLKVKGKQESQRVYILKEVPYETPS
jgi:class 3 adenylate cyclase